MISGVLALITWNAGNRALTPINGILFINFVPVTTFVISRLPGYNVSKLEVVGAVVTIAALVSNNLYCIRGREDVILDAPPRHSPPHSRPRTATDHLRVTRRADGRGLASVTALKQDSARGGTAAGRGLMIG